MLVPRPYQIEGRDFLAGRRHALLADEMRVGKTPQAILAAHKAGARTMLVTCPAIAVPHWTREIERWWPSGPLPRRLIWSYDHARAQWEGGMRGNVDVFVPDEAHFAKNPEAKRTKMVYGKDSFAWRAGATWPLSGTPAPKHAGELWCMLRAFGVVGMGYREFTDRYCTFNKWTSRITGTNPYRIPELKALLAKVMLRRTRKQVAPDMPDIGFDFLHVQPKTAPGYEIPPGLSDDALLEWLEAHQAASKEDRIAVAMAKVEPLADEITFAVENGLLERTVVFGWHTAPLMALTELLCQRGIVASLITGATSPAQRERTQEHFRTGEVQAVVANIMAAGTAIDLSRARHGYFIELWWVGYDNLQAANRLVSMDKMDPVTFDVCTWAGSTDDRVCATLIKRMRELKALFT